MKEDIKKRAMASKKNDISVEIVGASIIEDNEPIQEPESRMSQVIEK